MTRRTLNAAPPPAAEVVDLVVHYTAAGETKQDTFAMTTDVGLGGIVTWNRANDRFAIVYAMLRPLMLDDDGLPSTYEPLREGKPVTADDEAYDPRIEDPTQWSSARRFDLLSHAGGTVIHAGQLIAVLGDLVAEASGGRPTGGSGPSSPGRGRTKRA